MIFFKIGDARKEFTRELLLGVEQFASEKKGLDKFCILVTSHPDTFRPEMLKTTMILIDVKRARLLADNPLLNSLMFYVDKTKGRIDITYCLPADIPLGDTELEGDGSEIVAKSANKVAKSIVYNGN